MILCHQSDSGVVNLTTHARHGVVNLTTHARQDNLSFTRILVITKILVNGWLKFPLLGIYGYLYHKTNCLVPVYAVFSHYWEFSRVNLLLGRKPDSGV